MILVQLVDESGKTIGQAEKLAAHKAGGLLHRAVSVVLINDKGEILVQRRAAEKYHFAGKWANAGCTHPTGEETPIEAGRRALMNELGIDTPLVEILQFKYDAYDPESDYTEREYDHVLVGEWSGVVRPNPAEVSDVAWLRAEALLSSFASDAEAYAYWFHQIIYELAALSREHLIRIPSLARFTESFVVAQQETNAIQVGQ